MFSHASSSASSNDVMLHELALSSSAMLMAVVRGGGAPADGGRGGGGALVVVVVGWRWYRCARGGTSLGIMQTRTEWTVSHLLRRGCSAVSGPLCTLDAWSTACTRSRCRVGRRPGLRRKPSLGKFDSIGPLQARTDGAIPELALKSPRLPVALAHR